MAIKLEKVSIENNKHTLVLMGMQLGIRRPAKMEITQLINLINKKVAEAKNPVVKSPGKPRVASTPKAKVPTIQKTLEELGYAQDEVVTIKGRVVGGKLILEGRQMKVTGTKGESLVGFLINPKTGALQASEILMPKVNTFKMEEGEGVAI